MTLEGKIDDLVSEARKQTALLQKIAVLLEVKNVNSVTVPPPLTRQASLAKEVPDPIEELSQETLPNLLKRLSYSGREILKLRYGIVDGSCYRIEEVGNIFKVTRERIRQIEAKTIKKIARRTGSTIEQVIDALATYAKNNSLKFDPDTVPEMPISSLHLSARGCKCMNLLEIQTIGELIQKTACELLEVKHFGVSSLNEIREKLVPYNVRLRDD